MSWITRYWYVCKNLKFKKKLLLHLYYILGGTLYDYLLNRNGRLLEEKVSTLSAYFISFNIGKN